MAAHVALVASISRPFARRVFSRLQDLQTRAWWGLEISTTTFHPPHRPPLPPLLPEDKLFPPMAYHCDDAGEHLNENS